MEVDPASKCQLWRDVLEKHEQKESSWISRDEDNAEPKEPKACNFDQRGSLSWALYKSLEEGTRKGDLVFGKKIRRNCALGGKGSSVPRSGPRAAGEE